MAPSENDKSSAEDVGLPSDWKEVKSSGALHRRFAFDNYAEVSRFLDKVAELSEETELHPDLSFATTYVNVTVPAGEGNEEEGAISATHAFADRVNQIFEEQTS